MNHKLVLGVSSVTGVDLFFFFTFAVHIIVGRLFTKIHPSLQYSPRSLIHTSFFCVFFFVSFFSLHMFILHYASYPWSQYVQFSFLGFSQLNISED